MDSRLTIQTRRRYTSTEPTNGEELRAKYRVMSNLWLLAKQRIEDLSADTFLKMEKRLLGRLCREDGGRFASAWRASLR